LAEAAVEAAVVRSVAAAEVVVAQAAAAVADGAKENRT
jgi:hypothetical protein